MAYTIRDVAKLAKVSPSTVSAVINEKGYVSFDTRNRVNSAIRKLDYTPVRLARYLATRTSGNVGFIVSESHFNRAEPFYTRVFLGAEIEARKHDLYVLLTSISFNGNGNSHQLPRFLQESNVDGVMIAGRVSQKLINAVLDRNVPTVMIDYGNDTHNCSKVLIDNRRGIRMAVRHLLKMGHRKIAFVGGEIDHPSVKDRLNGFYEGLEEGGIKNKSEWVIFAKGEMSPSKGNSAFKDLWSVDEKPTAIICANDAMASGVINAAKEQKISIPEDLSIVGFDDVAICTLIDPQLTTIRVNKEDLGAIAIRTLADLIHKRFTQNKIIREGVEFIERQSTSPVKREEEIHC
ncbi:MAG: LacI family DNA-binding transcriptional regulator [Candidatus Electryonea clarkiae]|nr:LacI family DNA-binding transcriptional regulator [Candidatus Electryonea clarkiae]MDP8289327.1 LacI family DNA-binding transcriptional regulator [Candidatus Electryonea clarkiae]